MAMPSSSNNSPMYTPASSTTGSVLDDPFEDTASLSTHTSKYNGPKTVLAPFFYLFTTFLHDGTQGPTFTLNEDPVTWPNILRLNNDNWDGAIRQSIDKIARRRNGAPQLLLVIFWSYILKDEENTTDSYFWTFARQYAVNTLFKFQNAPGQYLGRVKNVYPRNQGHLRGLVSDDGQLFFKVDSQGSLIWLSESEALELADDIIGHLPTFALEFV
jgi:hypothetical protein